MFGGPAGRTRLQYAAARMPDPQERAAGDGLVGVVDLQGVVAERRPEVPAPLGLPVVAVRPRVGQHIDPVVPDLDGQRVGVGVRGDGQEAVRAGVAAAPDLPRGPLAAQDGEPRVGEVRRTDRRSAHGPRGGLDERVEQRGTHIGSGHRGPPVEPAEHGLAGGQERGPAVGAHPVHDQTVSVVGVALARGPQPAVDDGGERVGHPQQHEAYGRGDRHVRGVGLGQRGQAQLQYESVVFGGQLAVEAGEERVAPQVPLKGSQRTGPPTRGRGEPVERAGRGELPGGLGDDVIVRRGAPAGEGGQPALVVPDLVQRHRVVLEQTGGALPSVEQPADPHPRQESDAQLDPADPMHAAQRRVGRPPRPQVAGHALGVPLVPGHRIGGGEYGEVLVPGRLPDLLDVPHRVLVAVRHVEGVAPRGPAPGLRVVPPVRVDEVVADHAEVLDVPGHQPVGLGDQALRGVRRHRRGRPGGQHRGEPGARHGRTLRPRRPPPPPAHRVGRPARDLLRPHPGEAPQVPARTHGHRGPANVTGAPLARPVPTARVAAVVATSDSSGTGIGPPDRTALTNAASSAFCPLSRALGSRELTHRLRP